MKLRSRRVGSTQPRNATKIGSSNAGQVEEKTKKEMSLAQPPRLECVHRSLSNFLSITIPSIVYYRYSAPEITLVDSGELCLAAAGPGVAHPAGFPAWVMLSHVFTRVLPSLGFSKIRSTNLGECPLHHIMRPAHRSHMPPHVHRFDDLFLTSALLVPL